MSESVTQGQFFEAMQQIRDLIEEKHTSQRLFVGQRFDVLDGKFDLHEREDRLVEKRVTRIDIERELEAKQAVKRGVWAGLIASAFLNGMLQAVKMMFGK